MTVRERIESVNRLAAADRACMLSERGRAEIESRYARDMEVVAMSASDALEHWPDGAGPLAKRLMRVGIVADLERVRRQYSEAIAAWRGGTTKEETT